MLGRKYRGIYRLQTNPTLRWHLYNFIQNTCHIPHIDQPRAIIYVYKKKPSGCGNRHRHVYATHNHAPPLRGGIGSMDKNTVV